MTSVEIVYFMTGPNEMVKTEKLDCGSGHNYGPEFLRNCNPPCLRLRHSSFPRNDMQSVILNNNRKITSPTSSLAHFCDVVAHSDYCF
jgi:hypothetical protein